MSTKTKRKDVIMKRKIICAITALSMLAATPLVAADGYQSIVPISAEITEPADALPQPWYKSFTGTVVEIINPAISEHVFEDTVPPPTRVMVECENEMPATLIISHDTVNVTGNPIKVGSQIIGFFEANMPMLAIWPPQYNVTAIAVDLPENQTVVAARFDEYLVSDDGWLKLNISENTNIIFQDGKPFEGEVSDLFGRKLVVVYDVSTRSIPALTSPIKVVVMFERAVHLPGFGVDIGDLDGSYVGIVPPIHYFTEEELAQIAKWQAYFIASVANSKIVIDGTVIDAPAPFVNEYGVIMLPLRAIAEALGYEVIWSDITESIWLNNVISLKIGKDSYTFARLPEITLGTAPVLTEDGHTFVPMCFFQQVMNVPNIFFFEEQVVIDTDMSSFIPVVPPIHYFTEEELAQLAEWTAAFNASVASAEIVVNDVIIDAPAPFVNEYGVIMLPLRAIAETLGYEISWSDVTESIWLNNIISLRVGEDAYIFARMPVITLGTAPVITEDGYTFVPMCFFREVMRVPNVYFFEGQVVINSADELME